MTCTVSVQNSIGTISPLSRFDFKSHREFKEAYESMIAAKVNAIHISFAEASYMDSSALGMLLMLNDRAKESGISMELIHVKPPIREILEIANFQKLFTIK